MRASLFFAAACAAAASACATSAAPPPPPGYATVGPDPRAVRADRYVPPPTTRGAGAARLAHKLLADIAARVVETEEGRSGLGGILQTITLYEAPRGSQWTGLCEVTAHEVMVEFVTPGTRPEPPPVGQIVRSTTRWSHAGTGRLNEGDAGERTETEAACRARTTAADFFTGPHGVVLDAVKSLEDMRYFASEPRMERALTVDCAIMGQPCDGKAVLRDELTPDRIQEVRAVACSEAPGAPQTCPQLIFRDSSTGPGAWVMTIQKRNRPAHVVLRQNMRPVT